MGRGKKGQQAGNQKNSNAKKAPFLQVLEAVVLAKYGGRPPYEAAHLLELLAVPADLSYKDAAGTVVSKGDKGFKIERAFADLVESLTTEERLALLPDTLQASRDMRAFASATKTGRNEDTIWRKLTGYPNCNREFVAALAARFRGRKPLEIMAGNGLLAALLREAGLPVVATDIAPGRGNDYISMRDGTFCDVLAEDAMTAVKKRGPAADLLLCSWPPQGEEMILRALEAFTRLHPAGELLYFGEWQGGCNATDAFFDQVTVVDPLEEINRLRLPHLGSRDAVRLVKLQ